MPKNQDARAFIITLIVLGGIFAIHAALIWKGQLLVLAAYIVAAGLASTLKVQLPGIPGTFSANCLVTVLALDQLSMPDVVFIGLACALVQSFCRTKQRPSNVQVAFNAGVFAVSGTAAGWTYEGLQAWARGVPDIATLAIASGVFFLINTGAVSAVMALMDGVPLNRIWRVWHVWSLPYYLINIALAVLLIALIPASAMLVIASMAPLILGPFAVYYWLMRRVAPAVAQAS